MARSIPGQTEILRYLSTQERASDAAEITKGLELSAASRRKIRELLDQLVLEGKLRSVQGDRYRVPLAARDLGSWEGVLSVHPRGFAFVNTSGSARSRGVQAGKEPEGEREEVCQDLHWPGS